MTLGSDHQTRSTEPVTPRVRQYWAFISYSHRDKAWADWLHRRLESYRVPRKLTGARRRDDSDLPKRLYPIFRDREELPTSANLGSVISTALARSRYLVVICSPNSAASRWVNQEILAFKALGKADRVLALIVDGEPNVSGKPGLEAEECFPPALRFEVADDGSLSDQPAEPVAADARPLADGKRNALLKLLAGLLGVDYALLNDREHRRRLRRALGAVGLTFLLVASALTLWGVQEQRRLRDLQVEHQNTLEQRNRALRNLAAIYLRDAQQALQQHRFGPALLRLADSLSSFDTLAARVVTGFALPALVPELARWPAHQGPVLALAVVGSGPEQRLISSGADGRIQVLRWRDLARIAELGQQPWVSALAARTDGELLASGMDGLRRLDLKRGSSEPLPGLTTPGVLYAIAPTGMAAAALDPATGIIRVISLPEHGDPTAGDQAKAESIQLVPERDSWRPSGVLRFSADGRWLAAGGSDGSVQLWDLKTQEPAGLLTGLGAAISALAFSPDAGLLAAGEGQFLGGPGAVQALVWDLAQPAGALPMARLSGHRQQINQLTFSPDGRLLASSSDADRRLALWRVSDFDPVLFENPQFALQPLAVLPQLEQVRALHFTEAGAALVIGDAAGNLRLLDTGGLRGAQLTVGVDQMAVAASADRAALLKASDDRIGLWSAADQRRLDELIIGGGSTTALAISDDGTRVAWAQPGEVVVKTVSDSAEPLRMDVNRAVQALAFSEDGTTLALAGPGWLQIRALETGAPLVRWEAPSGERANIRSLALSPDGGFVALATTAAPIVLSLPDLQRQRLEAEGQPVLDLAFARAATESSVPAMLVGACQDGLIRRWKVGDWSALEPLRGQQQLVAQVAVSRDGSLVAAVSGPELILWDGADAELIYRGRRNRLGLASLGFASEGSSLLWRSASSKTLDAAAFYLGDLSPWLESLTNALDLGLPYRLDTSGEPVPRSMPLLARRRLQAVREGRFPWPLEAAGLSEAAMAAVAVLNEGAASPDARSKGRPAGTTP